METSPHEDPDQKPDDRLLTLVDDWGIAIYPLSAWERMRAEAGLTDEAVA